MSVDLTTVKNVLGPLYLASQFNTALFAFECIYMVKIFFSRRRKDSRAVKAILGTLWVIDAFGTVAAWSNVWSYGISGFGNTTYLSTQHWGIIAYVLTTCLTGFIVQAFLAQRLYQLTKSWVLLALVAPFWLGALGAGLVAAVFVALFPGYNDRAKLTYPVVVYLICSVVTDALVAVLLVHRLWGARRQLKQYESSALSKPLERLIFTSVETGGITALIAICGLVTFVADAESNNSASLGICLGRLYSGVALFCVLQKRTLADDAKDSANASRKAAGTGSLKTRIRLPSTQLLRGARGGNGSTADLEWQRLRKSESRAANHSGSPGSSGQHGRSPRKARFAGVASQSASGERVELDDLGKPSHTRVYTIGRDQLDEDLPEKGGAWSPHDL